MAHILVITSGLTGIRNASYELVHRLKHLGHEVTYGCVGNYKEEVSAQGLDYIQFPNVFDNTSPPYEVPVEAISSIIKNIQPNLVIADIEMHECILVTYALNIPLLLLSPWFCLKSDASIPPITSSIVPEEGKKYTSLHLKDRLQRFYYRWYRAFRTRFKNRTEKLLKYAKQIDFPQEHILLYRWPKPFSYQGIPILSSAPAELEFEGLNFSWMHYHGPMVDQKRRAINLKQEDLDRLAEVLAMKQLGLKVILCVGTSMHNQVDPVLKTLIEAAQDENWIIIARKTNETIQSDHCVYFDWIPQLEVLQLSDVCVHHAGINTINECIEFNVPMLVYSGGKHDQNGCAARIAHHKLGIVGNRATLSVNTMKRHVQTLLTEASAYKTGMEAIAKAAAGRKESQTIQSLINSILAP